MKNISHKRIYTLDELRGLAIICMVIHHSFYSMQAFERFSDFGTKMFDFFVPASPFFAGLFIIICGICCHLSRSNYRRGLILLLVSLLLTCATLLIDRYMIPDSKILFGIIHLLAVSILLYRLTKKLTDKIPVIIGLILNALLFAATYNIEKGIIGVGKLSFAIPEYLYRFTFLFPFGICQKGFFSADFYPLVPWFFIFMCGAFLGRIAENGGFPKFMYRKRFPVFASTGKYTLWIYILHQPVIYCLLFLADRIISLF